MKYLYFKDSILKLIESSDTKDANETYSQKIVVPNSFSLIIKTEDAKPAVPAIGSPAIGSEGSKDYKPASKDYKPATDFELAKFREKTFEEITSELTYSDKRAVTFPKIQEQLDMQYHDQLDGTTTWKDAIAKVKSDNPKE